MGGAVGVMSTSLERSPSRTARRLSPRLAAGAYMDLFCSLVEAPRVYGYPDCARVADAEVAGANVA